MLDCTGKKNLRMSLGRGVSVGQLTNIREVSKPKELEWSRVVGKEVDKLSTL